MEERRRDVAQTLSKERIDKLSDWIGTVIGVEMEEPEPGLTVSDSPDLIARPREPVRPVDAWGGWDYILSCLSQINAMGEAGWVRVTGGSCHGQKHGEAIIRSMTIIEEPAKGLEWHQGMYTWREFVRMLWEYRGDTLTPILRGSPGCGAIRIDEWEIVEEPGRANGGYGGVGWE